VAEPDRAHLPGPFCITWSQIGRLTGSRLQVWYRRNPARICEDCPNLSAWLGTVRGSENGVNSTRHCARPWSISGSAEFHRAPGGNPVQANFAHGNQKWRASRSIGPAGLPEPVETGTENRRRGRGHFTIGRGTLPGGLPARRLYNVGNARNDARNCSMRIRRSGVSIRLDEASGSESGFAAVPQHQFECQVG
jgi:hypothetical protein